MEPAAQYDRVKELFAAVDAFKAGHPAAAITRAELKADGLTFGLNETIGNLVCNTDYSVGL
jgi:hypothetical protein